MRPQSDNRQGCAALLVAAVLLGGVFALWPATSRVNRTNYDRIKPGMTLAEVEAVLGPPGDYTTGPVGMTAGPESAGGFDATRLGPEAIRWWYTDTAMVGVLVDEKGVAQQSIYTPVVRIAQGPVDNLLWRAKRRWQRWFP
jgi:hypothetical protein